MLPKSIAFNKLIESLSSSQLLILISCKKIDAICSPVILEQWFSAFLFLHCHCLEFPFPATTMDGAERAYILPCRRVRNKPVMISETHIEGGERKQRKLYLTWNKLFVSLLSKSQETSVSKKGCRCWISVCDTMKKVICSGMVLNRLQNFIALWSTIMNLIGSCPPPIPQDYFRNPCAFSEFSLESWILCLNLNQFFPFMVWAPSLQSAHIQQEWPKLSM